MGTSAALSAAIQVKKMGKTVTVVSPDSHLGGLSSSGLGWTDSGKRSNWWDCERFLSSCVATLPEC